MNPCPATLLLSLLLVGCVADDTKGEDAGPSGAQDEGAEDSGGTDGGPDSGGSDTGSTDGGVDTGGSDSGSTDGGADSGGSDSGGSDSGGSDGGEDSGAPDSPPPDLRDRGESAVSESSGTASLPGCDLGWTRYRPTGDEAAPVVLLGHGFLRSGAVLADVATHWASWGLDVYALDLCHSSIWDTDHTANGEDMAAFAASLGETGVLYAGHSAGGLAALVAAAEDADAAGVVGLDPVEAFGEGTAAASGVSASVYGLFGEASSCNASSNGVDMYSTAPRHRLVRVTEADHCDFEGPTDLGCTLLCTGTNRDFSDEEIGATVRALSTAALLELGGGAADADAWWVIGGHWYDELLADGALSVP